jgi:hypothetical protein
MSSKTDAPPVFKQLVKIDWHLQEETQWRAIMKNPHAFVDELTRRWVVSGENFPFPEAAPIVFQMSNKIKMSTLNNHTLEISQRFILQELMNLNNTTEYVDDSTKNECEDHFEFEEKMIQKIHQSKMKWRQWPATKNLTIPKARHHTYITPYNGLPFPYAPTMRWVAHAMDFLDLVYFSQHQDTTKKLQGLYFRDRFSYYYDYVLAESPKVFLFPTSIQIGATVLLKIGCSAIQPLGIEWQPVFVDEYMQSPCNFFWHDLNHARRIHQHNQKLIPRFKNWSDMYQYQTYVCTQLMGLCKQPHTYRRMIKMILFEVMHEDAIPWDWLSIWDDIMLGDGNCFPYEATTQDAQNNRRTVKYYAKSAPTLATFYNKLRHEFFEQEIGLEYIVDVRFRTLEHVVSAVIELLTFIKSTVSIDYKVPTREEVELLILSQQYCEDKHKAHPLKLDPDTSFEDALARHRELLSTALMAREQWSIHNCSFVPSDTDRLEIYKTAELAKTVDQLCSKNGAPPSTNPEESILVQIVKKSAGVYNDTFALLLDGGAALLPSGERTSNGVNGVMISPGDRMNLFVKDDATTLVLLAKYLEFREQHKKELFDMVVKQMLEAAPEHSKYKLAADLLSQIGAGQHFDEIIGIRSFCQTWASSVAVGQPQFSVPSPHFQNRIYIKDASKIQNMELHSALAYMDVVELHDQTLETMGTAGAIKTFVDLDMLFKIINE